MSSRILIMIALAFTVVTIAGCSPRKKVLQDTTATIELSNPSQGKRLLYENENVIIEIAYNDFVTYLDQRIQTQPEQSKKWEELKASTELGFQDHDTLILEQQEDPYSLFYVADLLESGHAVVYDKQAELYVVEINVHTYAYTCGPLCGSGYRYFYLPEDGWFSQGTLFLEIMDWVS